RLVRLPMGHLRCNADVVTFEPLPGANDARAPVADVAIHIDTPLAHARAARHLAERRRRIRARGLHLEARRRHERAVGAEGEGLAALAPGGGAQLARQS